MGPLQFFGYFLAIVDLFDLGSRVETALRAFVGWSRVKLRRFPIKTMLVIFLPTSVIARRSIEHFNLTSPETLQNPMAMLFALSVMMIAIIALAAMAIFFAHIIASALHLFERHPKGILGSLGLLLTILPTLFQGQPG